MTENRARGLVFVGIYVRPPSLRGLNRKGVERADINT